MWVPLFTQLPSKTGVFEVVAVTTMSLFATSCGLPGLTLIHVFLLIHLQKSSHLFESREFTTAHLPFAPRRSLGGGSPPGPLNRRSPASTRRPRAMYFVATALAAAVLTAVT